MQRGPIQTQSPQCYTLCFTLQACLHETSDKRYDAGVVCSEATRLATCRLALKLLTSLMASIAEAAVSA